MQNIIRRWLVVQSTDSERVIREQNLRVLVLALLPLAALALLSQLAEWVFTGIVFLGVPISAFACVVLIGLTALTNAQRPEIAQWLLVLMLVPIVALTTYSETLSDSYNVLEVVIAVTLAAILLPRRAVLAIFALTFGTMIAVRVYITAASPAVSGVVQALLSLFAYGAITIPLVILIYYLRLLFDRQIMLLQTANQQTRAALLAAQAANESQARFLATMSHELRTPLNAIRGNTDLLIYGYYEGGSPAAGATLGLLQTVQRSTLRLLALINEVLDVARLDAGREVLQLSSVNVVELIGEAIEAQRVIADANAVRLIFTRGENAPTQVESDESKLRNIINNLTSNAVKFTPSGSVQVTLTRIDDSYWQLTVQDTGIGIAPDQLSRIFERFYQVDSSETRQYKGSGLGLAIVKETVTFLGGSITVQSQLKQGTVLVVTLPYHYSGAKSDA